MEISLSRDLEEYVNDVVKKGAYPSANAFIAEALRLFKEREGRRVDEIERLRHELQLGVEALDRGESYDGEEFMKKLRERIRARNGQPV